jgi:hypothetical protein
MSWGSFFVSGFIRRFGVRLVLHGLAGTSAGDGLRQRIPPFPSGPTPFLCHPAHALLRHTAVCNRALEEDFCAVVS